MDYSCLTGIGFSLYYQSDDIFALLISGVITSLCGLIIWLSTRKSEITELGKREGYLIVTLGWVAMTIFGAFPFIIYGSIPNYTDAFFETMSGFTTTGATILTDIEALPPGLLFWRSLTQWLGGMGIIVLSLAILPLLGIGGMQLFTAEVPGVTKDKIHPRVKETAKRLWGIYVILTATETILLMLGGLSFYDAINHSFTTMATGGFSTKNA
ncbi:MAG: potassium transporter TrkG, partial [Ignavibacteriaceae bacterium]|nr:potassium transporter TrkG [Ignavibacteriaceae bacterium]